MKSKTPAKEKQSRIPVFKTIEEEADFWDTHSLEEFADELEEVTDVEFVLVKELTVFLEFGTWESLIQEAANRNIEPSQLAQALLEDHFAAKTSKP